MLRLLLEDIKDGCLFVVDSCECIVMAYKNQVVSSVVPTFFRHENSLSQYVHHNVFGAVPMLIRQIYCI